jgi:hypothetical protein
MTAIGPNARPKGRVFSVAKFAVGGAVALAAGRSAVGGDRHHAPGRMRPQGGEEGGRGVVVGVVGRAAGDSVPSIRYPMRFEQAKCRKFVAFPN